MSSSRREDARQPVERGGAGRRGRCPGTSCQARAGVVRVADEPGELLQVEGVAARPLRRRGGRRRVGLGAQVGGEHARARRRRQTAPARGARWRACVRAGRAGAATAPGRSGVLQPVGAQHEQRRRRPPARRAPTAAPGWPRRPSARPRARASSGPTGGGALDEQADERVVHACARERLAPSASRAPPSTTSTSLLRGTSGRSRRTPCQIQYGAASAVSCACPRATAIPAAAARRATSATRRVLPIPASPDSTRTAPDAGPRPVDGVVEQVQLALAAQQAGVGPTARRPAPPARRRHGCGPATERRPVRRSSDGSCCSSCWCSRRSAGPGSTPSSSASRCRSAS